MMLPRTLEPEVMDSAEEATIYDLMDHQTVNVQFVADFLEFLHGTTSVASDTATPLEVLDLGTGTARIPIELCRQSDAVRIMAIDDSLSMLDIGRINLEIAGLTDRVMLDRVDAKRMDYPSGRFGALISNSLIHHLAEPHVCLAESNRVVSDGGVLFFRDLMRPESEAVVEQLVNQYTGDESEHGQRLFRESLHAALTLQEIRDMVSDLGFAAESVQPTSDRHWTWSARTCQAANHRET